MAGWLWEKFGLSAFVDSHVWKHSSQLQSALEEKLLSKQPLSKHAEMRKSIQTHVTLMLSNSLIKMIDLSECIFFINTPNSITSEGCMRAHGAESPWIYTEIQATKLLRINIPTRRGAKGPLITETKSNFPNNKKGIIYDAELEHMRDLDVNDLKAWESAGAWGQGALDRLYDFWK